MAVSRPAVRGSLNLRTTMQIQTSVELARLSFRRENEDYVDYGVRVETMLDKLNHLLARANEIRQAGGLV